MNEKWFFNLFRVNRKQKKLSWPSVESGEVGSATYPEYRIATAAATGLLVAEESKGRKAPKYYCDVYKHYDGRSDATTEALLVRLKHRRGILEKLFYRLQNMTSSSIDGCGLACSTTSPRPRAQ